MKYAKTLCLAAIFLSISLFATAARAQDSDGDGMPDAYEAIHPCLNPAAFDAGVDYDLDGLTSLQEYFASPQPDPCIADTDGDQVDDRIELNYGTDPLSAASTPGVARVVPEVRISTNSAVLWPSLIYNGSDYGLAWLATPAANVTFSRLSTTGSIGAESVLGAGSSNNRTDIVWTGSEYFILNYYLKRVDQNGGILSTASSSTGYCSSELFWNGTGVYYMKSPGEAAGIYVIAPVEVGPDGVQISHDEYYISWTQAGTSYPLVSLALSADRMAVSNVIDPYSAGTSGIIVDTPWYQDDLPAMDALLTNNANNPRVVWSGSEFSAVWQEARNGNNEIYFGRMSASETLFGEKRITFNPASSEMPSLVWTGSVYGVAWQDGRNGNYEIYFALLGPDGARLSPDTRISFGPSDSINPHLIWTGKEFSLVWQDKRGGDYRIYFASLVADPEGNSNSPRLCDEEIDADQDGLDECRELGLGTSDALPDSDFGCEPDGREYLNGRNPLSASDDVCSSTTPITIGIGTGTLNVPFSTNYHDARTEVIYLASEIGRSGFITSLAFYVLTIPGQPMENFTIRLKHTPMSAFLSGTTYWDSPWVVVYQNPAESRGATGWRTFTFSTPFFYNGADNLMVDVSFNNSSSSTAGSVRYTSSTLRTQYKQSNSADGDPLAWSGGLPAASIYTRIPNIQFGFAPNSDPDTDGDGMKDAFENYYTACLDGLTPDASGDPDSDGLTSLAEYQGGTNPCELDTDGDGFDDAIDCDPHDPNNWVSCGNCTDADGDRRFVDCDDYLTILGPDCDDADITLWDSCATCGVDADGDGRFTGCDLYWTTPGPDCDDGNPYAWTTCATCQDLDLDDRYEECDRYDSSTIITVGTGTGTYFFPIHTNTDDARTEVIYNKNLLSGSGLITAIALDVTLVPDLTMENFTIRMKHVTYSMFPAASWDGPNTGWTTVYQADELVETTGWHTFNLSAPFFYNANDNLLVDFSFDNSSASVAGYVRYSSSVGTMMVGSSNSLYGNPLDWTGTANPTPAIFNRIINARFTFAISISGPDCDDLDPNSWSTCATCVDADSDSWYGVCDHYLTVDGPDCDDGEADVYPGAVEICDGLDNQCPGDWGYGVADEVCDPADTDQDGLTDAEEAVLGTDPDDPDTDNDGDLDGAEVAAGSNPLDGDIFPRGSVAPIGRKVVIDQYHAGSPRLVWNGSAYGVWRLGYEPCSYQYCSAWYIWESLIDPLGRKLEADSSYCGATDYAWAWSGVDFTGAWQVGKAYLDHHLFFMGGDNPHGNDPALVWTGSEFGLAFTYFNEVRFRRYSSTGTLLGSLNLVSGASMVQFQRYPELVWNGREFGLTWVELYGDPSAGSGDVYFTRISAAGAQIGATVLVSSAGSVPDISTTASGYEVAFESSGQVYRAQISADGVLGDTELIGTGTAPSIATGGSGVGIARVNGFTYIPPAGNLIQLAMNISGSPDLAWNGSEFGLVYTSSNATIFTRIGVNLPPDSDGDFIADVDEPAYSTDPNYWDTDHDGVGDGDELASGLDPVDPDTDGDGMTDGWETDRPCLDALTGDSLLDADSDGLSNLAEFSAGTEPCDPDTDNDTWNDGTDCAPLDPAHWDDCASPDADGDGLSDGLEIILGTDPNDSDTDDDGVSDGDEYNTLGTDPLGWDSDNDNLPDGYEVANMAGHTVGLELNPLASADGNTLDFDGDGIPNAHDYWNSAAAGFSGNGVYVLDRAGYPACGYWGEGDGDGFIGPGDLSVLTATIKGDWDYSMVYPDNGETQDLDADSFLAAGDLSILTAIIKTQVIDPFPSRPTGIVRVAPLAGATLSGAVGDTVSVVVSVTNVTSTTAGIPVVFSIDAASSGSALILGGEGDDGLGTRYDLSTVRASLPEVGGKSRVVLKLTGAGTVMVNAKVKQCGSGGVGRYCGEVTLAEPVEVTVTP